MNGKKQEATAVHMTAATYVSGVRETPTLGQILYWSQTESTAAGVLIDCPSSHLPRPSGPTPYRLFIRQKRGKSEHFERRNVETGQHLKMTPRLPVLATWTPMRRQSPPRPSQGQRACSAPPCASPCASFYGRNGRALTGPTEVTAATVPWQQQHSPSSCES